MTEKKLIFDKAKLSEIDEIVQLRSQVLHPGGPLSRVIYKKDHHTETYHLVAKEEGKIVACGSMLPESELEEYSSSVLRIRGMSVLENQRGKGLGTQIIKHFINEAHKRRATKIWCNARLAVLSLYERQGFCKQGEVFDVPGSGPHYRMHLQLTQHA